MYVRRTETIVDAVSEQVDAMCTAELARGPVKEVLYVNTPKHDALREAIEKTLWHEAPDIKDKMPEAWLAYRNSINIKVRLTPETGWVHESFLVSTDAKLKLPPLFDRWVVTEIRPEYVTPIVETWVKEQLAVETQRLETHNTFALIKTQLEGFLRSHSSLNTALKEMPELKMYTPQEYLDKIAEKVVRAPKRGTSEAEKAYVDVDAITRAAVAHRITSAGG